MKPYWIAIFIFSMSCAGFYRSCDSGMAESFGADWVIVQQRAVDGLPYNCWILRNASVSNESGSDGIYWTNGQGGHLVHIAGQYARVQVVNGKFKDAAKLIGVDSELCQDGRYPAVAEEKE